MTSWKNMAKAVQAIRTPSASSYTGSAGTGGSGMKRAMLRAVNQVSGKKTSVSNTTRRGGMIGVAKTVVQKVRNSNKLFES